MDYSGILGKITPTEIEKFKVKRFSEKTIKFINELAAREGINARAVLVGSIAKNTWLSGHSDVDIFIQFPLDTPMEELKEKGLHLGHECIKAMEGVAEERYASHPYVTGHIGEYRVDFVPSYDIRDASEIKSAVDRTLLHTLYIKKHLKKDQIKEVLLLKKFMKAIEAYGSEFKVGGFAGYLCELLVLAYGDFEGVLEAAAWGWRRGEIIDIEGYGTGSKFQDPLIVVDPTDKNRNVAAALTEQKMAEFITAARSFLENPTEDYFKEVEYSRDKDKILEEFKKRGSKCILILFDAPPIPTDAIYPQLKKSEDSIKSHLNREGFRVLRSSYWTDEKKNALLIFELGVWKLPRYKKHYGPRVWSKIHSKKFREKYGEKVWVEGDRLFVEKERREPTAYSFLQNLLENHIDHIRLGKHVKEKLREDYRILDIEEFMGVDACTYRALEFLDSFFHPGKHLWR